MQQDDGLSRSFSRDLAVCRRVEVELGLGYHIGGPVCLQEALLKFLAKHATARLVDIGLVDQAIANRRDQVVAIAACRGQLDVDAGLERQNAGVLGAFGNAVHELEKANRPIVADHHARKAELLAQHILH